jgi:AmmeMemoRadiSam system protein B
VSGNRYNQRMSEEAPLPRLRPLDVRRVVHGGAEYFHLRDPLELDDRQVLVPAALGPLLLLLDGSRTLRRLRVELLVRYGLPLAEDDLRRLVDALSEACLLDDAVSAAALARARQAYANAPFRVPALAGRAYPADAAALTALLRGFEEQAGAAEATAEEAAGIVGLISPHIDYARGGPVYAALWRRAAPAVRAADVAVIFGTDHGGAPGTLTLTRRPYATPWGVLPADADAVQALATALGEEAAFADEIHHRTEHSVELAAVWLHYIRDGVPCPVVPLLCGHPQPYLAAGVLPDGAAPLARALAALRATTAGRRVVVVAAADLAHVGPAFGDPRPLAASDRARVRLADQELLAACAEGADAVLRAVGRVEDRYRVCGLAPIALALAFLGPVAVETVGYDQCPADESGGSLVSIAGAILRAAAGAGRGG